jgi:Tol biopolymer transport system component
VYVVAADGSGLTRVGPRCQRDAPLCEDRSAPAWSPSGRLAFVREWGRVAHDRIAHSEIFVADPSGAGLRQLTHLTDRRPYALQAGAGAWSPSGSRFVFTVERQALHALFLIGADGGGLRRLTPWSWNAGGAPDWSPDGAWILFRKLTVGDAERGDIYRIHPSGRDLQRLTRLGTSRVLLGSYAPDGRSITFASDATTSGSTDVFVMDADGGNLRPIVRSPNIEDSPDWGVGVS